MTGTFVKLIRENIGAKILAILFAIFIWFHVTAQQEEKQKFRIPLTLVNLPDSLIVVNDVPDYVKVTIKGQRSNLLRLRFMGNPRANVNLSNAKKGRINIQLSSTMLNIPEEIDLRDVSIEDPRVLVLNIEPVISKKVPVKIAYKGEIPEDVIITESPDIIPEKVSVSGARSIVNGIDFLTTEEIDIRDRRGDIMVETGLKLMGREVKVSTGTVLVEMRISKSAEKTLTNVPPIILQDEKGLKVEYSPRTVSITLEGPEDRVRGIEPNDISIILKVSGRKPGSYKIVPEVIVPDGIEEYWLDVDAFQVTVYPESTDRKKPDEKE